MTIDTAPGRAQEMSPSRAAVHALLAPLVAPDADDSSARLLDALSNPQNVTVALQFNGEILRVRHASVDSVVLVVEVPLGRLPDLHPIECMVQLLQLNFLASSHRDAVFCIDPKTEEVVYVDVVHPAGTAPEAFAALARSIAAHAPRWRLASGLETTTPTPSGEQFGRVFA